MSIVQNISDTALLTALYRAHESERSDALFRDPYARELAGTRAEQILHTMPGGAKNGYPIVVRTCAIDAFLTQLVQEQRVDTVLNLAAGLDTRPYRLQLPASLHWIEVDLPDIIAYKQEKLAAAKSSCILERLALDLTHEHERQDLFERVNEQAQSVLVITEGLLNYLTEPQVRTLGEALARYSHMRFWCTDIASPLILWLLQHIWGPSLQSGNTRFQFTPADDTQFFRSLGWAIEQRANPHLAHTLHREIMIEKILRLLSYLLLKSFQYQLSFGDILLLRNTHST